MRSMGTFHINALAIALGLSLSAEAMAQGMSKEQYKWRRRAIVAEVKSATAACGALSRHQRDACKVTVTDKGKIAKAELRARYWPSEFASSQLLAARVEAEAHSLKAMQQRGTATVAVNGNEVKKTK